MIYAIVRDWVIKEVEPIGSGFFREGRPQSCNVLASFIKSFQTIWFCLMSFHKNLYDISLLFHNRFKI